jgi:hypothetical protein
VTDLFLLKYQTLDARAEADRADAPLRVLFDAGPETALRLRYEAHLDRTLRSSVSELGKDRKASAPRRRRVGRRSKRRTW